MKDWETSSSWNSMQSQWWARVTIVRFQYSRKLIAQKDMKILKKTVPAWSNKYPNCNAKQTRYRVKPQFIISFSLSTGKWIEISLPWPWCRYQTCSRLYMCYRGDTLNKSLHYCRFPSCQHRDFNQNNNLYIHIITSRKALSELIII